MVTLQDARILAGRIKEGSPKVHGVELFGSVYKNGKGHDADLILIVDNELSKQFWSITNDINPKWPPRLMFAREFVKNFLPYLDHAFIWKRKQTRQLRASGLIGLDLALLAEKYRAGTIVDVWLMPRDWRSHIADITTNSNMLVFLKNAARSSVKLA
jgi:hypothetical protein